MSTGLSLNGPVWVTFMNLSIGQRAAPLTASGNVRICICEKEMISRAKPMCFSRRTHLHPSRSGDVQFLPDDSNHFAFEAGGVVLLGFVAEVRQQVKVFRVVRPFLLDVLRASSSPMQGRSTRELVSQDLGGSLQSGSDRLLTI